MPTMRYLRMVWLWLAASLLLALPAHAQDPGKIVRADFTSAYVDIVPFLGAVQSDQPQVVVKIPSASPDLTTTMTLQSAGKGPTFRWAVFTAANPTKNARELIIDAARQSFPGSGVTTPTYSSSRITAGTSTQPVPLRRLATPDRDAFALTIPADSSLTVALELSEVGVSGVRLWQRTAFDRNALRQALYRGIVLGMAMLAVIVITCLVVLSPQMIFPLSMIFAWPAVGFITLETGQLEGALKAIAPFEIPSTDVLSAIIEALMMTGVMLMGVTIMRTRRQMPVIGGTLMVAGGAGLALAIYAVFEPVLVKQLSRWAFAAGVGVVLLSAMVLASRGGVRARSSLLVWVMLAIWTVAAGYIAIVRPPSELASPVLVGGLALVLVALAFVLAYFAFSSALNPKMNTLEAQRNSLALASAAQIVWDFQPGDGSFFVGPQLTRLLGYDENNTDNSSMQAWIDLLHPNDHAAFMATLEAARQRGNQPFEQQLRLRHADGRYRWFTLKGSSLRDASETGVRLSGILSDASQQRSTQERMLNDALYDVVTGLPNYALYLDRAAQAVARSGMDSSRGLSVLIIDIDRFRVVNSRLGQEIGDSLLRTIAKRIEKLLPEKASLARLPGDQFAIICEPDGATDHLENMIVFVDKLRHAVSQPVRVPPNEIYLTCCVGVALWDPHMETAVVLQRSAEIALFDAKKRGKDKVSFYKPGMRVEPDMPGLSAEDIQSAVHERRLELVYQPIMRLSDRQLAGFEALVRLRRRDGAVLEPSSFLPLAERCGIIGDIGAFALSEAARQLGVWQRMYTPAEPVFVSVNVSSAQLSGPQLLHVARTVLAREELVPGSLKLELTETLVMENPELSIQVLERLKSLGIGLSCDDFGTGYSSLSYLRRLPFDTLKVDKSFLAAITDERGSVVLDAIILLAHDLGLQVVAEGVESQEQLDHLVTLECDLAQGFLIGEPIDAQHVLTALGAPSREPAGSSSGVTALWNRLSRKKPAPPPPPVVLEPQPDADADPLEPWSPYDFHPAPWAPRVAAAAMAASAALEARSGNDHQSDGRATREHDAIAAETEQQYEVELETSLDEVSSRIREEIRRAELVEAFDARRQIDADTATADADLNTPDVPAVEVTGAAVDTSDDAGTNDDEADTGVAAVESVDKPGAEEGATDEVEAGAPSTKTKTSARSKAKPKSGKAARKRSKPAVKKPREAKKRKPAAKSNRQPTV